MSSSPPARPASRSAIEPAALPPSRSTWRDGRVPRRGHRTHCGSVRCSQSVLLQELTRRYPGLSSGTGRATNCPAAYPQCSGGTMTRLVLFLLLTAVAPVWGQGGERNGDVPATHRPPPGMCRIWIDGVPPGRQPAPTDCATALRRRPPNARVIFGDEVRAPQSDRPNRPVTTETPRVAAPPPRPMPSPAGTSPAPTAPQPQPQPPQRIDDGRRHEPPHEPSREPPREPVREPTREPPREVAPRVKLPTVRPAPSPRRKPF